MALPDREEEAATNGHDHVEQQQQQQQQQQQGEHVGDQQQQQQNKHVCFFCGMKCPACENTGSPPHFDHCSDCIEERDGDVVYFCGRLCYAMHKPVSIEGSDECDSSDNLTAIRGCHPLSVRTNSEVGRHLVAARAIAPMEVVFHDRPFVVASQSLALCLVCLRKPDFNGKEAQCPACHLPMCSSSCAPKHASLPECAVLAELDWTRQVDAITEDNLVQAAVVYAAVGVVRYIDRMRTLQDKELSHLNLLMDHASDLQADRIVGPHLATLTAFLTTHPVSDVALAHHLTPDNVVRAYGVLRTNAFGFSTQEGGEGRALFPITSLMSHSCRPNVQHVQHPSDGTLVLVAQREIAKGEQLAVTYINQFQGAMSRRLRMREQWYFDCRCARCSDPTEAGLYSDALACAACRDPDARVLPDRHLDYDSPWTCDKCGHAVTYDDVKAAEERAMLDWLDVDQESVCAVEAFVARCREALSEHHHFAMKIKCHLLMLYRMKECSAAKDEVTGRDVLQRRVALGKQILRYLHKVDPGQTKKMGVFLLEFNKARTRLAKLDLEEARLDRKAFLEQFKEIVRTEAMAKDMIGRYTAVSAKALKEALAAMP